MDGSVEKRFREQEQKLGLLSKGLIDAICVINLDDLMYTYVSESIENLFGYSANEKIAKNIQECMTPESFQKVTASLLNAIEGHDKNPEAKHAMDIEFYHKNGGTVWAQVTIRIVKEEDGRLKAVGYSKNINERKKLELERERLVADLSDALEEQKRLERENKILMGLLPICTDCKKIRDEDGKWWPLEEYIATRSEVAFSHTLCPSCHKTAIEYIKSLG